MSYKCETCGVLQEPGTPSYVVPVAIRPARYQSSRDPGGTYRRGGTGWEIVKEKRVCPGCYGPMKDMLRADINKCRETAKTRWKEILP